MIENRRMLHARTEVTGTVEESRHRNQNTQNQHVAEAQVDNSDEDGTRASINERGRLSDSSPATLHGFREDARTNTIASEGAPREVQSTTVASLAPTNTLLVRPNHSDSSDSIASASLAPSDVVNGAQLAMPTPASIKRTVQAVWKRWIS